MSIAQRAEQFRFALQLFASTLDERTAFRIASVFDPWRADAHKYELGDYCIYGKNEVGDPQLYICIQGHTSQADWTPDASSGLFKVVGISEDGYPEWSQPVGFSDAYMLGDEVSYNGKHWVSDIDGNVWEPGVYGWTVK